nr:MAG TPA: oxidoreductase [Caudoviricetes sp.]
MGVFYCPFLVNILSIKLIYRYDKGSWLPIKTSY